MISGFHESTKARNRLVFRVVVLSWLIQTAALAQPAKSPDGVTSKDVTFFSEAVQCAAAHGQPSMLQSPLQLRHRQPTRPCNVP